MPPLSSLLSRNESLIAFNGLASFRHSSDNIPRYIISQEDESLLSFDTQPCGSILPLEQFGIFRFSDVW